MDKKNLKISLAARCNAAGRPNNEDNFQVSSDLASDKWQFIADEVFELGSKGVLLVACDGMGGMNAGEVASEIAVETIKSCFASTNITDDVLSSDSSIRRFVIRSIQAADAEIKRHGEAYPDTAGMGSTIVIVWIYDHKAYVGWCGDSRAYRFNPQTGIERLSHDHSYVQELVDAGKLSEELAFDHPNSNIITRSLGDPNGKAKPDFKAYNIHEGDIFLLCSDGLCGTLRDEEISAIIADNSSSTQKCLEALWIADEQAGWTDNVTTILAKVEGEVVCEQCDSTAPRIKRLFSTNEIRLKKKVHILMGIIAVFVVVSLSFAGYFVWKKYKPLDNPQETTETTAPVDTVESINNTKTAEPQSRKNEPSPTENNDCVITEVYYQGKLIPKDGELDTVPAAGDKYTLSFTKQGNCDVRLLFDKYDEMISESAMGKMDFSFTIKKNNTQKDRNCKVTLKCNDKTSYVFYVVQKPFHVTVSSVKGDTGTVKLAN